MIVERDVQILVCDGFILRADIFRPDDGIAAPVIMTQGPYGKGVEFKTGYSHAWNWILEKHPDILPGSERKSMTWETVDPEIWTVWGYVVIRVDGRGSGRSPGLLDIYSPLEIRDFYQAIEWAGIQPWSSGKVGLNSISYYGATQWLVAALQPPHLTAMIPWEGFSDFYRDWLRHGGIASNTFLSEWFSRQVVTCQHGNPKAHTDPWLLELSTGPKVLSEDELLANRTDPISEMLERPLNDQWYQDRTPDFSQIKVPFLSAANWGGLGLHSRGNFEAFSRAAFTQKWLEVHSGRHDETFYLNSAMDLQKRFLDHFLRGVDNGWEHEPPLILQLRRPSQPEGEIRQDTEWPLPHTKWTKLFLSASDMTLSGQQPFATQSASFDAFGQPLKFISSPFEAETEITGPLAMKLCVSSSTSDADIFVTFQAFSPTGDEVDFQGANDAHTPLSQGWLRASQRKLDAELTTAWRPYHTHDESQPLVPDEKYELDIELWPTSIILPVGYRVVIVIGGKDFERETGSNGIFFHETGSGPFLHNHPKDRGSEVFRGRTTVYAGGEAESYLLLPIIKR